MDAMSFIWDKFYLIGISEIDDQHESFVNLLNQMHETYETRPPSLPSDEVKMKMGLDILSLRKYALNHFSTEEKYMIKSKYPKYFAHKKQHDAFIKKIFELEEKLINSQDIMIKDVLNFMSSWFEGHIQKVDRHFGNYFKLMSG